MAQNLTQLMIGRSPMPIAVCRCEQDDAVGADDDERGVQENSRRDATTRFSRRLCGTRSSAPVLYLRTMRPLLAHPPDGEIRYTLDGSIVTTSSVVYRGPVRLSQHLTPDIFVESSSTHLTFVVSQL